MPTQDFETAWRDPSVAVRYANSENATRPFAKILVDKTNLAKATEGVNVFDLATGTGALVAELYAAIPHERWGDVKVLGGDVSASMLAYLKARGEAEGWSGLKTEVVDGNVSQIILLNLYSIRDGWGRC
jgi:ubiquinone/menaquinone biosynthesis C-methylase UbiE